MHNGQGVSEPHRQPRKGSKQLARLKKIGALDDVPGDSDELRKAKAQLRHLDEFGSRSQADFMSHCHACDHKPSTRGNLIVHLRRKHLGDVTTQKYECIYCSQTFQHSMQLNAHVNA